MANNTGFGRKLSGQIIQIGIACGLESVYSMSSSLVIPRDSIHRRRRILGCRKGRWCEVQNSVNSGLEVPLEHPDPYLARARRECAEAL